LAHLTIAHQSYCDRCSNIILAASPHSSEIADIISICLQELKWWSYSENTKEKLLTLLEKLARGS
jgi:hypothetical protein